MIHLMKEFSQAVALDRVPSECKSKVMKKDDFWTAL